MALITTQVKVVKKGTEGMKKKSRSTWHPYSLLKQITQNKQLPGNEEILSRFLRIKYMIEKYLAALFYLSL